MLRPTRHEPVDEDLERAPLGLRVERPVRLVAAAAVHGAEEVLEAAVRGERIPLDVEEDVAARGRRECGEPLVRLDRREQLADAAALPARLILDPRLLADAGQRGVADTVDRRHHGQAQGAETGHRRHVPLDEPAPLTAGDAGDERQMVVGPAPIRTGSAPVADRTVLDGLRVGLRRRVRMRLETPPDGAVVRRVLPLDVPRRFVRLTNVHDAFQISCGIHCARRFFADPTKAIADVLILVDTLVVLMKRRHTARDIPRLGPGRHRFDPTLYLVVTPAGSRSWVQRIVVHSNQIDRGLGSAALVTLEQARFAALSNRRAARVGGDPFADRKRAATVPTFADAAAATLDANRERWADTTIRSWQVSMRRHVLPRIGSRPVNALTRQDVINCLAAIKSTSEGRKATMRIRATLELALSHEWVAENVAANGGLAAALPHLRRQNSEHHAAAPYTEVGAIIAQIAAGPSNPSAKACTTFLILTACRSTEASGAEWSEIDFDARVWTIPATRMKSRREHRVPLSDAALAILAERRGLHPVYCFASVVTSRPLSQETLSRTVRDTSFKVHGFRSSFRDWASDVAKAPREVAEAALAHVVGSQAEQSYARSDLCERRRALMGAWGAYCTK